MIRVRRIPLGGLPPDRRRPRRLRVHPTPTGVVVAVGLVLFALLRPAVADPGLAGVVWAAVLGGLLVGAAWPVITVLAVRVEPAAPDAATSTRPAHLVVGRPGAVPVHLGGRPSELTVRWVDDPVVAVVGAGPATTFDVPLTPVRRGRFPRLLLKVSCDAPFGLVAAHRTFVVPLPRTLVVAPAPEPSAELELPPVPEVGGTATSSTASPSGESVRSVRPYVTGDPAHLVHWPTTARTGSLVVRELEPPAEHGVALVLDLGPPTPAAADDPDDVRVMPGTALAPHELAAERAVTRAGALAVRIRHDGGRVVLCTADPAPLAAEVVGDDSLADRLAAATGGEPGAPPRGWDVYRITAADRAAPVGGAATGTGPRG